MPYKLLKAREALNDSSSQTDFAVLNAGPGAKRSKSGALARLCNAAMRQNPQTSVARGIVQRFFREYLAKTAAISALCLVSVTASWAQAPAYTFQVMRSGGSGHVSSTSIPGPAFGGQINCGPEFNQCHTNFHPDTNVVLTATPTQGFRFDGWEEGCDSVIGNECYITMHANTTVRANFSPVINMGTQCESREFSEAEKTIIDAYIAYYGRPPDAPGLWGWAEQLENSGLHEDSLLAMFGDSEEFRHSYGHLPPEQLVNNLYVQIFGREGDSDGIDFYTLKLQAGEQPLATIAMEILRGAMNDDVVVLENRRKVARHFATVSEGRLWKGDIKALFSVVNGQRMTQPKMTEPVYGNDGNIIKESEIAKDVFGNDIFETIIDEDEVRTKANSICTTYTDMLR